MGFLCFTAGSDYTENICRTDAVNSFLVFKLIFALAVHKLAFTNHPYYLPIYFLILLKRQLLQSTIVFFS